MDWILMCPLVKYAICKKEVFTKCSGKVQEKKDDAILKVFLIEGQWKFQKISTQNIHSRIYTCIKAYRLLFSFRY